MNRYQLEQMLAGIGQDLKSANEKLTTMYADAKTTLEARNEQKNTVKDLEERFAGIKAQIEEMDRQAEQKFKNKVITGENEKDKRVNAKAELIKATMSNNPVSMEVKAALGDNNSTGGEKFLPKTMQNELLHEPFVKNPLRDVSTFTNETNLEVPKITFTLDNDDFIADTETAKELKADGDTVQFGRHKFKVFAPVSETILRGTNTNIVQTVEMALESGLSAKEKKVAFTATSKIGEEHMSFYSTKNAIKTVEGVNKYKAIKAAIADLHEDYRENAKIIMRYADYTDIIEMLANGNATLYAAQPEQILGKPAIFCDSAVDPIVGDMRYSHFNYDLDMLYERDKDIKTGMECFVLTAWFDHQIKLKSAFRIAKTTTP
ncbi:phage major capsid protein [Clostridium botulinum]|uniref:Putative phage capsid protein n=1 Tax=Clostridium botulinum (strain Okra / Type B1) TaxID=498213 RepID=B1IJ18_CLOBK|nr:phage major capsid protein [Clostridium botulinum]EKX80566.1 phage capsid protein [Clostridium botulinum CFSAN001628]ACA43498.1 putative phage capsid protein [Clostridium botulinum B1 str. Okra]MBD5564427.1 phage major capsid protein [Clostridium botulinum]MBD5566945.1 phage major capsid protein [Clostridium botulinum]MBD5570442.1 phage major capsid protein [Clostridium botulinum]